VIKRDGRIFIAYAASGTGPEYTIGLLEADENSYLLDVDSWTKQGYPVLTSADVPGEYGPGHNSFTVDEKGNDIFVYHARSEECYLDQCDWSSQGPLYDPCRHARLKRVHWAADGTPILKMSYEQELAEKFQTITATVKVKSKDGPVEKVTVTYQAGTGGKIQGTAVQTVIKGGTTAAVTAVADSGYVFSKWSDGLTTAVRSDKNVTASKTVTALFTKKTAEAKKVTLNKKNIKLGVGESFTLKATVTPSAASQKVNWTSNKTSVVTVSAKGKLKARNTGNATITAKTANGKKITCKVTVKKAPNKITVKPVVKNMKKGSTVKLKVNLLPKGSASYKIKYSSNRNSIVSVSKAGKITAKKIGKATITVKTFNGKRAKVSIIVK